MRFPTSRILKKFLLALGFASALPLFLVALRLLLGPPDGCFDAVVRRACACVESALACALLPLAAYAVIEVMEKKST